MIFVFFQYFFQLIYDGGNSFKFISLKPDKIPPEDKEQLEKVGINIPSIM